MGLTKKAVQVVFLYYFIKSVKRENQHLICYPFCQEFQSVSDIVTVNKFKNIHFNARPQHHMSLGSDYSVACILNWVLFS